MANRHVDRRARSKQSRKPICLSAVFNNKGTLIATGADNGKARIWNGMTGCLERTIEVGARVWSVCAFSPDDRTLATASGDGLVKLWDLSDGLQRQAPFQFDEDHHEMRAVSFSRDGSRIAFGGHGRKTSAGGYIGLAQISDFPPAKAVGDAPRKAAGDPLQHGDWVQSVGFVSTRRAACDGEQDGKIRVWKHFGPDPFPDSHRRCKETAHAFSVRRSTMGATACCPRPRTARWWCGRKKWAAASKRDFWRNRTSRFGPPSSIPTINWC